MSDIECWVRKINHDGLLDTTANNTPDHGNPPAYLQQLASALNQAPPEIFGPVVSDEQREAIACWLVMCDQLSCDHLAAGDCKQAFHYLQFANAEGFSTGKEDYFVIDIEPGNGSIVISYLRASTDGIRAVVGNIEHQR